MLRLDPFAQPLDCRPASDGPAPCPTTPQGRTAAIAALRRRIADIASGNNGDNGDSGDKVGNGMPNDLRPAFETAKRSLSPRGAPPGQRRCDALRGCTGYQYLSAVAGRLQDALDVVDAPVVPVDSDPDADLDPDIDPRLMALGAWLVEDLPPAGAVLPGRDGARRPEALTRAAAALITGAERFDRQVCEDLVRALIQAGDTDGAWGLLCGVRASDAAHRPTLASYLALIEQFGREGRGHRANQAFERLRALHPGEMRDPRSAKEPYDRIVAASDRSGHSEAVRRHADAMRAAGVPWDGDTVMAMVNAESRLGQGQAACRRVEEARLAGVPILMEHLGLLIRCLIDSAEPRAAVELLLAYRGTGEERFNAALGWTGHEIDGRALALARRGVGVSFRESLLVAQVLANDALGRLGESVEVKLGMPHEAPPNGLSRSRQQTLRRAGWHLIGVKHGGDGVRLCLNGDPRRPFRAP